MKCMLCLRSVVKIAAIQAQLMHKLLFHIADSDRLLHLREPAMPCDQLAESPAQ